MGNTLKLEDLLKPDCLPDESAGGENWRILHGDTLKLVKSPNLEREPRQAQGLVSVATSLPNPA